MELRRVEISQECCIEQFPHQVAGHRLQQSQISTSEEYLLCAKVCMHTLLHKKILISPRDDEENSKRVLLKHSPKYGRQECKFYYDISLAYKEFACKWIPQFYGYSLSATGTPIAITEDLTWGMQRPCVIDLKLGTHLHDPLVADEQKRNKMIELSNSTTSAHFGLRVCGMQYYCSDCQLKVYRDKTAGKLARDIKDLSVLLHEFLACQHCQTRNVDIKLMMGLSNQLNDLKTDLQNIQKHIRLYSASLLILFDADATAVTVKLIDFAHSYCDKETIDCTELPSDGTDIGLSWLMVALQNYF